MLPRSLLEMVRHYNCKMLTVTAIIFVKINININIYFQFSVRNGGVVILNDEFFNMRPTFDKFKLLLECYSNGPNKSSNKFRKEIDAFMDKCKKTLVFKIFEKIVQQRYKSNEGVDQKLKNIWFQNKKSSFQHIFAGSCELLKTYI